MASPEDEVPDDIGVGNFGGASPNPYLGQLLQGMASPASTQPQSDTYSPWQSHLPALSQWVNLQQQIRPEYAHSRVSEFGLMSNLASPLEPRTGGDADPPLINHATYESFVHSGLASDTAAESNFLGGLPAGSFPDFTSREEDIGLPAAEVGRDMCADALNQWAGYQAQSYYNPFGTADVFQTAEDIGRQTPSPPPQQSAPVNAKPSYCDVAKNYSGRDDKIPSGSHRESSRFSDSSKVGEVPITGPGNVPYRKSRSNSRSHKAKDGTDVPPVLPDSKYGLDNFEDPSTVLKERVRRQHSSGSDSLPLSRKGSTSSIGSGSSSLDEILAHRGSSAADLRHFSAYSEDGTAKLSSSMKSSPIMQAKVPVSQKSQTNRKKSDSLGGRTGVDAGGSSASLKDRKPSVDKCSTKPFFDPKRIFQKDRNRSDSIPNNHQHNHDPKGSNGSESFFDPKRIFSKGKGETNVPNNQHHSANRAKDSSVLNNGKLGSSYPSGGPGKPNSTHYIVNDLRHTKKHTNTDGKQPSFGSDKTCNTTSEKVSHSSVNSQEKIGIPASSERTSSLPKRRKNENLPRKAEMRWSKKYRKAKEEHGDLLGDILGNLAVWCRWAGEQLGLLILNVTTLILKCAALLVVVLVGYFMDMCCSAWSYIWLHVFCIGKGNSTDDTDTGANKRHRPQGLKENIVLPTTGDEAMRRLLACKGKDPYSILGVRMDASDEEVKKYYRKQAVLVHPDKNQQAGAEEAFKILGHAFELIGEPEKRQWYDAREQRCEASEAAMQEFADLLSKLHEKIQEEANTMRCYNCGGKHRRVLKDRPAYSARYCDRCNTCHAAKEGDVWAETTMLGFLWHYFACMEGKIYDITEWASCQSSHFQHIQANSHQVNYRIATNGSRQRHQQREPDLEDFINHLFHHTPDPMAPHAPPSAEGFSFPRGQTSTSGMNNNAWSSSSHNSRKKRKKKKH